MQPLRKYSGQMSVLVIDDDAAFRCLITEFLREHDYITFEAPNCDAAIDIATSIKPDYLLLDLNLGVDNGYQLLKNPLVSRAIIIVVSVTDSDNDRIQVFELGADDFMQKPINLKELMLRMQRSLQRRDAQNDDGEKQAIIPISDGSHLDLVSNTIFSSSGEFCALTKNELKLFLYFLEHQGETLSRDDISQHLFGRSALSTSRAIDNLVSRVRRKTELFLRDRKIVNIRYEGYKLTPQIPQSGDSCRV